VHICTGAKIRVHAFTIDQNILCAQAQKKFSVHKEKLAVNYENDIFWIYNSCTAYNQIVSCLLIHLYYLYDQHSSHYFINITSAKVNE